MKWQDIYRAPKDGTKILAVNDRYDDPYITQWVEDVYSWQGGAGGPSGWFSGNYDDRWGDRPRLDRPKYFIILPSYEESDTNEPE